MSDDLIAALIALSNDLGGDPEGTIMQGVAELTRFAAENRTYAEAHAFNSERFVEMLSERDAAKAEIARLTKVVARLGSSEAFTTPAVIRNTWEGRELTARLDFARAALKPDTGE